MSYYWLYLENYVYINCKLDNAILYNTLDGKIFVSNNKKIVDLLKKLNNSVNPYIVRISEPDLNDKSLSSFIIELKNNFMVDYFSTKYTKRKPFQVVPRITDSTSIYSKNNSIDIFKHVDRINLYLNSTSKLNYLNKSSKQSLYPIFSKEYKETSILQITKLFTTFKNWKSGTLSLIAGDIFKYSEIGKLLSLLKQIKSNKCLILQSSIFSLNKNELNIFRNISKSFDSINIIIDSFSIFDDINTFKLILDQEKTNYSFFVKNTEEIRKVQEIIKEYKLEKISIIPFFDGNNYSFFSKNVFITKESFNTIVLDMKELLLNKIINRSKYGEISIDFYGNVYSDINLKRIGNLNTNKIEDLVLYEIKKGRSWKLTRNKVNPCRDCIYCDLCPPISNYELCFGKYNLCTIVK